MMQLSVNGIILDSSLRVKVGQTFLNLFIDSNRVIVFSECTVVRSDIYFFADDSPILFPVGRCRFDPVCVC